MICFYRSLNYVSVMLNQLLIFCQQRSYEPLVHIAYNMFIFIVAEDEVEVGVAEEEAEGVAEEHGGTQGTSMCAVI